jgi:hypothetical protein
LIILIIDVASKTGVEYTAKNVNSKEKAGVGETGNAKEATAMRRNADLYNSDDLHRFS